MQPHHLSAQTNDHHTSHLATNTNSIPTPNNLTPTPRPSRHTTSTTTAAATPQACAACKYRRRKCTPDCILAPYYPHDRQPQFLNAHRLFGVSNIVKIVCHLSPADRDTAMRTIAFESDARAADPAGGCHRIVRDLERRISLARAELEAVLHHLAICRAAAAEADRRCQDGGGLGEAVAVPDVDSWSRANGDFQTRAEPTSPSFHHHGGSWHSVEECTNDVIRPILDDFDCEDGFREEGFRFDSHGNITTPSDNGGLIERATFKEDDDECLSYIQDDEDLKVAATFIGLTN